MDPVLAATLIFSSGIGLGWFIKPEKELPPPLPPIVKYCEVTIPVKPLMPFTENAKINDSVFTKSKEAMAEIEVRKGYEAVLEAAVRSCSGPK